MVTSGLRIGTPALATRGFGDEEFTEVADIIAAALRPDPDLAALRTRVKALTDAFPLYPGLEQW
jgi:glycine hydroxymethyltransferase